MVRLFILLASLLGTNHLAKSHPQTEIYDSGGPLMAEQAAYDIGFYDLTLFVNPEDSTIQGKLRAEAEVISPLSWFVLDLDTVLRVEKTEFVGKNHRIPLEFTREGGKLWIKMPEVKAGGDRISVEVSYGGKPMIASAGQASWSDGFLWTHSKSGEPWLGIVSVLNGADIWWPCKDHPSDKPDSMALHITVPEPLTVAANGHLRNYTRHGGRDRLHTFDWFISTPINNYSVTLNIAQYSQLEGHYRSISGDIVPLTFWVMPENYAKAMRLFPQFSEHLRFLEEILGPYPFRSDKYSVAQTPYLGMEHQTIISYGANFENNPYGFDGLHFHELAHEWFANLVTAPDWRDWWLHEGVATYLEALYAEKLNDEQAYHQYIQSLRGRILNLRSVAPRASQRTREIYGTDIYNKGAWILHSLRYLVGKDILLQAFRRLTYPDPTFEYVADGRQCHFATTDDFQAIVEELSGQDLEWFFEIYLRQPELPRLVTDLQDSSLQLRWDVPSDVVFSMPVEVMLGEKRHRVDMAGGHAQVAVSGDIEPVVDPSGWLLTDQPLQTTSKVD